MFPYVTYNNTKHIVNCYIRKQSECGSNRVEEGAAFKY